MATKTLGPKKLKVLSPRNRPSNRSSVSPSSLVSSAVTQGKHQKAKISNPSSIQKKLNSTFELAIGLEDWLEDTEVSGIVAKRAYMPKDNKNNSNTGRLIVDDATFVTELVEMDFRKDTQQNLAYFSRKSKIKCCYVKQHLTTSTPSAFWRSSRASKHPTLDISSEKTVFQQSLKIRSFLKLSYFFDAL